MFAALAVCTVASADEGDADLLSSSSYVTIYRLYNPYSGEHLYTESEKEYNYLGSIGWKKESVAWKSPTKSSTPVYRLYNRYSGDHHYTTSSKEYNYLGSIGWTKEDVSFWSYDGTGGTKAYRLFNPYETVGTHHYTTSKKEYDYLSSIGWKPEGECWCGAPESETTPVTATYKVTFNTNGGSAVSTQTVQSGKTASQPKNPTKSGYTFGGWYSNSALTKSFNFSTPITANTTLYAKWNSTGVQAFAVYSAVDNSLDFYKRVEKPTVGAKFNGKTATSVFYGIETDENAHQAWYTIKNKIASSSVVDSGIKPVGLQYWWFYSSTVKRITGLDKLDTSAVTDLSSMFSQCTSLEEIQGMSSWDTSNVTSLTNMFSGCDALKDVDASNWNLKKLKYTTSISLNSIFEGGELENITIKNWRLPFAVTSVWGFYSSSFCPNLKTIDMSGWETSSLTSIYNLCAYKENLVSVNISGWDTSKVTNMHSWFESCPALESVIGIDALETGNVTSMYNVFKDCGKLQADCSKWNVSKMTYHDTFCENCPGVIEPNWVS